MRRLPLLAFGTLAAATVVALFVVQHLKAVTPLYNGNPRPVPGVIYPLGTPCLGTAEITRMSFYLQHRADNVAVRIVDTDGGVVRTLATDRHMRRNVRIPDGIFNWDGRTDSGAVAPAGTYYWRLTLLGQNRTVLLPFGVQVALRRPARCRLR